MSASTQFKLKGLKPDKDFIEWNELMSKDFDQDFYYERSNPFIVWVERKRLKAISNLIKKEADKNNMGDPFVLEVGCGAGQLLQEIESTIKTKNLIGIDPLADWLTAAKKRLSNGVKLLTGFAEDLPFENNSMDFVVCSEVLEHVIDPRVVLKELGRVVKKSGFIIVSVPNEKLINNLKEIIDLFKIYNVIFPKIQKHNDWHIHEFDLKSFEEYIPTELKIQSDMKIIPFSFLPLRYVITFKVDD